LRWCSLKPELSSFNNGIYIKLLGDCDVANDLSRRPGCLVRLLGRFGWVQLSDAVTKSRTFLLEAREQCLKCHIPLYAYPEDIRFMVVLIITKSRGWSLEMVGSAAILDVATHR
jgi:hypothetical protein